MSRRSIHVLTDDAEFAPPIASALRRVDADIRLSSIEHELRRQSTGEPDARLVLTSQRHEPRRRELTELFAAYDAGACPTLVLGPAAMKVVPEADGATGRGSIGFATNMTSDELVGRLTAMCEFRAPMDRLHGELSELRRRDRRHSESLRYLGEQIRLAGQVQRDMLPVPPPRIRGANIRTFFRPAEQVSGDLYGIARLDAEHVAISLADATGHGLPAALLTMFARRSIKGIEGENGSRRPTEPVQVLRALHEELTGAGLSHCQFVAALYAIYHEPTRRLRWARAGTPYPILLREGEHPRQLPSDGVVLGVIDELGLEPAEVTLEPDDVVVFHSDGVDSFLVHEPQRAWQASPRGGTATIRCTDLTGTRWFQTLTPDGLSDHLIDLEKRLDATPATDWPVDDVTVLALEVTG